MSQCLDSFDLQRFLSAQQPVYGNALAARMTRTKRTHGMRFIFPQVGGLGRSAMAQHFAIRSMDEPLAYLAHPLLGARLAECTRAMLGVAGSAHAILGSPDDMKFRSSMTLFGLADTGRLYQEALERFFDREEDSATLEIVSDGKGPEALKTPTLGRPAEQSLGHAVRLRNQSERLYLECPSKRRTSSDIQSSSRALAGFPHSRIRLAKDGPI